MRRSEKKLRKVDPNRLKRVPVPKTVDWARLILDLRRIGISTSALSLACGLDRSSLRHYVSGRKTVRISWEVGQYLLSAHREFIEYG